MSKKFLSALKICAALLAVVIGIGAGSITCKAAFDAPYYNINVNGGTFDGEHYVLDDGTVVKNAFFCDGTYTYYLQADGTPMKDRLTYHPDGEQVIYFDADGHECFDTFANVKRTIAGDEVDDLCYFGSTGNLYVNVITYNREGTKIYYANPYGVVERNGVFELDVNAVNYSALANGCHYGYANSDGSVVGFYATYEEAAGLPAPDDSQEKKGYWMYFGEITYDGEGNQVSRLYDDGNTEYEYRTKNGQEYLSSVRTDYYDTSGRYCGYNVKYYTLKDDGATYLSSESERTNYKGQDQTYWYKYYDEAGNVGSSTVGYYNGSSIIKRETFSNWGSYDTSKSVTVYNYSNGKLVSAVTDDTDTDDNIGKTYHRRTVQEYDANEELVKNTSYVYDDDGVEKVSGYEEYIYTIINNKQVLARMNDYYSDGDGRFILSRYEIYGYDEYGNRISEEDYYVYEHSADGGALNAELSWTMEAEYIKRYDSWTRRKYMTYYITNGEKYPSYGYEYFYNSNNDLEKYVQYGLDDNNQLKVARYTLYGQSNLPKSGKENEIASFEYSRSFNGNDVCTGYVVDYYIYVIE